MNRLIYKIDKTGSLGNLKLHEENLPFPKENEVTIEVKSIGLNFADIFAMLGLYSATPKTPFIPGLEYSGIITQKGERVNNFNIDDKVMGLTRFGAYSNFLNIDSSYLIQLPEIWNYEDGAAFLVNGLTAYYALIELGNIKSNKTVLIHSAAGGVGIYANRIAKMFDAFTIGTIGSSSKTEQCKKEGYDKIIVRGKNFKRQLKEKLNERNLDIVLECIGGRIFKDSFALLAPQGRLITYGSANFNTKNIKFGFPKLIYNYLTRPKIDPLQMINANRSVMGFNLIWLWEQKEKMSEMFKKLNDLHLEKPLIGKTFTFNEVHSAISFLQSGKSIGKVVVNIE
ncbi:MAG: zinc-binding dehydrogenase [Chlorobi bacterium]|nr:zinc-binding dehydrogenase [Chlorobiota bacterium]